MNVLEIDSLVECQTSTDLSKSAEVDERSGGRRNNERVCVSLIKDVKWRIASVYVYAHHPQQ